jgi:hypothetical protein
VDRPCSGLVPPTPKFKNQRTGLAEVIAWHGAQYVNVTEAWWDGACAPAEAVRAALRDVLPENQELASFIPSALLEVRGLPLLRFARFKACRLQGQECGAAGSSTWSESDWARIGPKRSWLSPPICKPVWPEQGRLGTKDP